MTDYVSIGDYVLTGGELPAMVMVDAISRMVPGVLTNQESGSWESFENDLLEYPQYSRPEEWQSFGPGSAGRICGSGMWRAKEAGGSSGFSRKKACFFATDMIKLISVRQVNRMVLCYRRIKNI